MGRLYTLLEPELKAVQEYLDKNLQCRFTCLSKLPLSTFLLFVKKKFGELWLSNDYYALNAIGQRNRFPCTSHLRSVRMAEDRANLYHIGLTGGIELVRIKGGMNRLWHQVRQF